MTVTLEQVEAYQACAMQYVLEALVHEPDHGPPGYLVLHLEDEGREEMAVCEACAQEFRTTLKHRVRTLR